MVDESEATRTTIETPRRRALLWTGLALPLAAIALVVLQYSNRLLIVPWYAPLLTTLGAALLLGSVVRRRSVPRLLAFGLIAVLAGLEWHFLLSASRLPSYDGPVTIGRAMPPFQSKLADGRPFTEQNLQDELRTALVFFRGRW
jgi:hypothetical protein